MLEVRNARFRNWNNAVYLEVIDADELKKFLDRLANMGYLLIRAGSMVYVPELNLMVYGPIERVLSEFMNK